MAVLIFLLTASLYIRTLVPEVYWGEGPLLSLCGAQLGISHPPGYPVQCLMLRMACFIPLGSLPMRGAMVSGLMGALAVAVASRLLRERSGLGGAIVGAAGMAKVGVFWQSATMTEVYAVNAFLVITLFYVAHRFRRHGWHLALAGVLMILGVGGCHHLSIAMAIPSVLLVTGLPRRVLRRTGLVVAFGLLGLSGLLYHPIRAQAGVSTAWGAPTSMPRFLTLITATEEAAPSLAAGASNAAEWAERLGDLLVDVGDEMSWPACLLFLLAAAWAFRSDKRWTVALLGVILFYMIPVSLYHTHESRFFLIPVFIAAWLVIAEGLAQCLRDMAKISKTENLWRDVAMVTLLLVFVVATGIQDFSSVRWRRHYVPGQYGRVILRQAQPKAVIITERSDLSFLLWYLQEVEGWCQDRAVFFRHLFSFPWANAWYQKKCSWVKLPRVENEDLFENSFAFNSTFVQGVIILNGSHIPLYITEQRTWMDAFRGGVKPCWPWPEPWLMRLDTRPRIRPHLRCVDIVQPDGLVDNATCETLAIHLMDLERAAKRVGWLGLAEDLEKRSLAWRGMTPLGAEMR